MRSLILAAIMSFTSLAHAGLSFEGGDWDGGDSSSALSFTTQGLSLDDDEFLVSALSSGMNDVQSDELNASDPDNQPFQVASSCGSDPTVFVVCQVRGSNDWKAFGPLPLSAGVVKMRELREKRIYDTIKIQ